MTITVTQNLDHESLTRLADLRGQRWRYLGGPHVSNWMTDVSLIVATEESELTISGEVDELDFEGEQDSYSRLRVDQGAADLAATTESGHRYYFHAGEEVRDVLIVQETVRQVSYGQPTWTYTNDIAIVFALRTGAIALAQVSHHSELLGVVQAADVQALKIEEPSHIWTDKLGVEHHFTRDTIPIRDLLGHPPSDGQPTSRT
ncbi:MAG: hypothetical protein V9E98_15170 [Candidatus Nanopelagicales bacterium]